MSLGDVPTTVSTSLTKKKKKKKKKKATQMYMPALVEDPTTAETMSFQILYRNPTSRQRLAWLAKNSIDIA